MKLSFSTRGWPKLTWDEMIDTALDMGFGGIEVYNLPKFDPMLEKGGPFHKHKVAATVRQLRDLKLTIPCFDTSVDLSSDPEAFSTLTFMLENAANAQVPYVVAWASRGEEAHEQLLRSSIEALLPDAEELGVCLLIKTSGIYADTARLRALLESYARGLETGIRATRKINIYGGKQ